MRELPERSAMQKSDGSTGAGRGSKESDSRNLESYDAPQAQVAFVFRRDAGLETVLLLEGVHCSACLWLIESVLARLRGVIEASVNYTSRRARVLWDPSLIRLSEILREVRRFGYGAFPWQSQRDESHRRTEQRDMLWRLLVAGLGMMQVMMYALPEYVAGEGDLPLDLEQLLRIAGLVLTVPVMAYSAAPFFAGAWRDLARARLGMDVPIAAGVAIAFAASVAAVFGTGDVVYFDSISMFVFLILAGRYGELLARERAADTLAYLGRSLPEFALLLPDYPESRKVESVHVSVLKPGDCVLVGAGEAVPADGVVTAGNSAVEESVISGESEPLRKSEGSTVYAGSANSEQPLIVRLERVGAETLISGIARLAERACGDKPPLTAIAERLTGPFIASVLVMAAIAGLWWASHSVERAIPVMIAVLVATCPCAFALAAPVARVVALAGLARRGLVATRGGAIESLAAVTDVVLDKTGTLTHGMQSVISVSACREWSAEHCTRIAAALESGMSHPIARALARAAPPGALPEVRDVSVQVGAGIEGTVEGRRYRIGRGDYACGLMVERTGGGLCRGERVVLADEDGVIAAFRISDELRVYADAMVESLKALGLVVHLLSGDAEDRVQAMARRFSIDNARGGALPEAKQAYVRALQAQGRSVLMVGDGVNDAPVLAQADASIALGSGAALAQMRADAVLLHSRLPDIAFSVAYSRRAVAVIRQNLIWAFAYNLSVLPLALAGELAPWAAAIGMSASSLLVIGNSLRLAQQGNDGRCKPSPAVAAARSVA